MKSCLEITPRNTKLLDVDDQTFRKHFNQSSFLVSHQLSTNPLFEFDRLFQLLRAEKSKIYWDMGDVKVNQRFNEIKAGPLAVDVAFKQIETSRAWMIFRSVQRDPEYRALLENLIEEIEARSGVDFRKFVKVKDAIIFVTSPQRVSTFHIDKECSFLLQVRGNKTAYIFNKDDREVMPEEEVERSWTVNNSENPACYKEQYQCRAHEWHLMPGNGVHIPVGAPHWVKNDNNVSISLNINVHFHDFVRANVYRANYLIRKAGFKPTPPGRSRVGDALKRSVVGALISARQLFRSRPRTFFRHRKCDPPWK